MTTHIYGYSSCSSNGSDSAGSLDEFIVSDSCTASSSEEISSNEESKRPHNLRNSPGRKTKKRPAKNLKDRIIKHQKTVKEKKDEETEPTLDLQTNILHKIGIQNDDGSFTEKIIGRERESLRIISMLLQPMGGMRPLLVGPSGVGKLAIVEKTAQLFKTKFKNSRLKNPSIYCLDSSELMASDTTSESARKIAMKFKSIIEKKLGKSNPPILYIRDIDKILNFENISEYFQHILKTPFRFIASISGDPKEEKISKLINTLATFNFATIPIAESPIQDVCAIVRQCISQLPAYSNMSISDESINMGVRLAAKYERACSFPNKALNLIYESAIGVLLKRIAAQASQNNIVVTPDDIAEVMSSRTGIEAEDLKDNVVFNEKRLIARLKERIIGQDHAIEVVSQAVACWKMGFSDDEKPCGVFLFIGSTGVGKTELSKLLAKYLYQDNNAFIRLDGSEYKEEMSFTKLIGAPPGYEGHDAGGQLTEALKKNRNRVVLVDEFEKMHDNARKIFLQVFDAGRLTDSRGFTVDCTETLFIMTTNLGSETLYEACSERENEST